MAASALIVTQANGDGAPTTDGIFAGLSFFLVQKLPSRSSFVTKIQSNGGRVVKLETQADHIIADHIKPINCPPGSLSYTFIDKALEDGSLPDPTAHTAGAPKGTVRPIGSGQPGKSTRTAFTAEDDRVLWIWARKHEKRGASIRGNELYKRLEEINPRHTFQAWRDRYIKKLHDNPPPGVDEDELENGDHEDEAAEQERPAQKRQQKNGKKATSPKKKAKIVVGDDEFDQDDVDKLLGMAEDIDAIQADRIEEAWESFNDIFPQHSAVAWQRFWDEIVRPEYRKRRKMEKEKEATNEYSRGEAMNGYVDDMPQKEGQMQSTPDRPQSSSSLKRKRGTPTPRKQATYGRKKQKEGHEIFGDAGSDDAVVKHGQLSAERSEGAPAGEVPLVNGRQAQHVQPAPTQVSRTADGEVEKQRESSALPTSEANRAAATQLDDDYQRLLADETPHTSQQQDDINDHVSKDGVSQGEDQDALITSDANRAAAMQLDDDFEQLQAERTPIASQVSITTSQVYHPIDQDEDALHTNHGGEALITSDLNRDADRQLRRESLSIVESVAVVPASDLTHFPDQQGRETQREDDDPDFESASGPERGGVPHSDAPASQIEDDDPSDLVQPHGNALTEANLATQDEQHRSPLVRGTDLPQDDEAHDQSDFVQYLQGLQRDATSTYQSGFVPGGQDAMVSGLSQQPASTTHAAHAPAGDHVVGLDQHPVRDQLLDDEPLSSQQELDDIMDATLNWPESPGTAKAKPASQLKSQEPSAQFESQIHYPALLAQPTRDRPESLEQQKEVRYPDLPQAKSRPETEEELRARFDREVLGIVSGSQDVEGEDADVDVDEEILTRRMREQVRDDDIYVHMPEPEGGLGFSSSQAQPSQQRWEEEGQRYPQQDDVDLEMPEPEGGSGISSSPPKSSQHMQVRRSPVKAAAAKQLSLSERNAAMRRSAAAIEITSSSSSSSSEADPQSPRSEAEDDDMPLDSRELSSSPVADPKSPPNEFEEDEDEDDEMPLDYPRALDTQDIYNAETQAPDFHMPLPDDASDSLPSSPRLPSSPTRPTAQESQAALAETQPLSDADVNEYVDRMTLAYNYKEDDVVAALKCTSMRAELADLVLLDGKAGKGLPQDVAGIWSAEEDRSAEGGDARALRRLEEKHGWKEVEARMEFLQEWREDEEEGEEL